MNSLGGCLLIVAALLALSFGEPSRPWHLNRELGGYAGLGVAGGGFSGGGDLTRDMGEKEQTYRLLEMIERLGPVLDTEALENVKRGLDLGMSRGFSGSQAAKHMMGMAAASYAGGPGRRRRAEY